MATDEYLMYLRKSRSDIEAEARGEGETLARHEHALLALAKQLHLNVTAIYREVVSGETIASRPKMQQLLSEVEQGVWAGVLVMEVERLARGDTIDQGIVAQAFKFSGTRIITPMKTYDPDNEFDEEYFEFGLFMSRREYKTINRRLQRGREASVKEGKFVGNKTPYGYNRVKLPHEKGWTLEPDPEQAEVVRLIYELYTHGEQQADGTYRRLGACLIARRLNALQIPPKTGDHWSSESLRGILTNPVYIGKVRWNHRPAVKKMVDGNMVVTRPRREQECLVVDGKHPPIIESDQWHMAQEYMRQNRPQPVQDKNTLKNPLAGLVICGKCGRRMTRRPYTNRALEPTLICQNIVCDNVSSNLCYVEARILKALQEWLNEYRIQWVDDEETPIDIQIEIKCKALQKLESELEKLNKQVDNLHDLLEQGVYTTDVFLARSKTLAERIQQAKHDHEALQHELELDRARAEGRRTIIPKVEHLLEVYYELPTAQAKNDMLKEVLEKVVYIKTKNGRWHNAPDDFEITLYPKLPLQDSFHR